MHGPSGRPQTETEGREDAARSVEVDRLRREVGGLKGLPDTEGAGMARLRRERMGWIEKCKRRESDYKIEERDRGYAWVSRGGCGRDWPEIFER